MSGFESAGVRIRMAMYGPPPFKSDLSDINIEKPVCLLGG